MEKTFISIADPSENPTQVVLPSETTSLPNREGNDKTCFCPKKVSKLGQLSLSGQKWHSITPWSSFLGYNNWPCPCFKTSKPKVLTLNTRAWNRAIWLQDWKNVTKIVSQENLKSLSNKRHLRAVFVFFNFNITLVIKITYTLLVLASYWKIKLQKSPKCHKNYVPEPIQYSSKNSCRCCFV